MNLKYTQASVPLGEGPERLFIATCPSDKTARKVGCTVEPYGGPQLHSSFPTSQHPGLASAVKDNLDLRLLQQEPVQWVCEGLHHVHRHRELLVQVESASLCEVWVKLAPPEACIQQRAGLFRPR